MQTKIHPKMNDDVIVTCSCGKSFTTSSTKESITVEVCSQCHPFYTGEQRFLDTKGTVDKFLKKEKEAKKYKAKMAQKRETQKKKQAQSDRSLKDLLGEV